MCLDLDLNLPTIQNIDAFRCYHFCLMSFGLELMIFVRSSSQLSVQFWTAGYCTDKSVPNPLRLLILFV